MNNYIDVAFDVVYCYAEHIMAVVGIFKLHFLIQIQDFSLSVPSGISVISCPYIWLYVTLYVTLHSSLNVKELHDQNMCDIWSLSDSNGIRTHNYLVRKRTLNHLAKVAKPFVYKLSGCGFESHCCHLSIHLFLFPVFSFRFSLRHSVWTSESPLLRSLKQFFIRILEVPSKIIFPTSHLRDSDLCI